MRVAYRLHCANINEVENVYVGVIEFKTRDANEMAKYIQGLGEDADELYTIEEYTKTMLAMSVGIRSIIFLEIL